MRCILGVDQIDTTSISKTNVQKGLTLMVPRLRPNFLDGGGESGNNLP